MTFQGSTITAVIDGATVGHATDTSYLAGQVGLGTAGYQTQEFDNLSVTGIGTPPVANAYEIVNKGSGRALSVDANGFAVQSAYTAATSQQWQLTAGSGSAAGWLTVTERGLREGTRRARRLDARRAPSWSSGRPTAAPTSSGSCARTATGPTRSSAATRAWLSG